LNANWQESGRPNGQNSDNISAHSRFSPNSIGTDFTSRPDKDGHILNSWKFRLMALLRASVCGHFFYRVEAFTQQTLKENFAVLCGNASFGSFTGDSTKQPDNSVGIFFVRL